ncbi:alpha/beta fold hydrolase [Rhodococcus sp. I2R]|uniref:alpha/beta fold hydrolase n=1 Tax=Rhodococcus sp. I2R TaxID=2855445 RepID=UPI001E30D092|nr:alpha/beta hydrolase [Rhodococcus sp. I2R]MCC8927476.1 alpha/beta hydrolase [Rhodococcus sp. I2R]
MLLFFHGAGGYEEDRSLAAGLGAELGARVDMPHFSDEDMSFEAWAAPMRSRLAELGPDDHVIAHSFGASILLRVLSEGGTTPTAAVLLAMPDWSPDGWDVAEYAFHGPEPDAALTLHHCRDDAVVPFAHLALGSSRLPSALVREYPTGGHQFDGVIGAIAASIG